MTDSCEAQWEPADVVEEGEWLFVQVGGTTARYGVGIKSWQGPEDAKDYMVANWPWAGKPTHAMRLPKPPEGVTYDEYMAPSRALLHAAILKRRRDEVEEALAKLEAAEREIDALKKEIAKLKAA